MDVWIDTRRRNFEHSLPTFFFFNTNSPEAEKRVQKLLRSHAGTLFNTRRGKKTSALYHGSERDDTLGCSHALPGPEVNTSQN